MVKVLGLVAIIIKPMYCISVVAGHHNNHIQAHFLGLQFGLLVFYSPEFSS